MGSPLQSSLSSTASSGKSGKSKFLLGALILGAFPLIVSTFAASVTVGTGSLEFGQGSQQATACDSTVFVALGEEWKSNPSATDTSDGFFRVRSVTISNLDLQSCVGKKLRVRLIDNNSAEITLGPNADLKVLQITLPAQAPTSNLSDQTALQLTYLNGIGQPIPTPVLANVAMQVSGTSIYNGSVLTPQNADVTFFIDPTAASVNINGQIVRRTTVETVDNPSAN